MNRSILIVICDFLLISLLAFSTLDVDKVADPAAGRRVAAPAGPNPPDPASDLTAVMRQALDDERKSQDRLSAELAETRRALGEREQKVQTFAQQLQSKEQEAASLKQEQSDTRRKLADAEKRIAADAGQMAALATDTANLKQEQAAVQQKLAAASRRLETVSTEAAAAAQRLAAAETSLRGQTQEAAALQQQIEQLAKSNQTAVAETQRLAAQLQAVEAEKRAAAEQIVRLRDDVRVEREEKAKLTEGVLALAKQSGNLARELHDNRALAPNTIFNEFLTNRLYASFRGRHPGFLGFDSTRDRRTGTVLVTDGTNIFALCHVQDTPLALANPGDDWEALTGSVTRRGAELPLRSLAFARPDPRVVLMPVAPGEAGPLGVAAYPVSADPFKFQDAVVIGAAEGYYGQCKFEIDESTPNHVRLDRRFLQGLFGQFNPSAGDFVFSRSGEILGVMVNNTYCLMIRGFAVSDTIRFGPDLRPQHTGETLARLSSAVLRMPFKLQ